MQTKIYPPIYFFVSVVAMVGLNKFLPLVTYANFVVLLVGCVFVVSGGLLILSTAHRLKREKTAIKPFAESSVLLTNGLFSFSRNPIYLGMVLLLCGAALSLGSLSPFIVLVIFFVFIRKRFILREEQHLLEQFGDDYRTYQAKVRRWL